MSAGSNSAPLRLLVTGASGFVGRHVRDAVAAGVFGHTEFVPAPAGLDLRDAAAVDAMVADAMPDCVLHLAAQSFVPRAFEAPQETIEINLVGTLHLLQSLKRHGFKGRLLYISSGDVYGQVPDEQLPVTEALPPAPRNPYAVSKVAAELLCRQWHWTEALDVVILRPFNHIGPGQSEQFVLPALARQVVDIAAGRNPGVIDAGDIDTTRDFTDVRDVVAAYAAALRDGHSGATYLVASGVERRVRDLLEAMCRLEGVSVEVRQDPARLRRAEQRRMVASAARLREDTGWAPQVPIETTLNDILTNVRKQS